MKNEYIQQGENFLNITDFHMNCELMDSNARLDGDQKSFAPRCKWLVSFQHKSKNLSESFEFTGACGDRQEPSAYDVLACLQKSAVGTFDGFCSDYGYSNNSIKALEIYSAVQREFQKVQRLWGNHLDALQEIQ